VQPVIDPGPVGLIRQGGAVAQFGEPCLGAGDGVEDFGERALPVADRAQVGAVRFGDGQRDPPGGQQFDALQPSRRACMAYLVSYPCTATSSGRLVCAPAWPVIAAFCASR
jgi:hypothetical protein